MINIVLYKPDIPQNTAAIVRLSACLNLKIHIIEPCGFNLNDSRFKRVVMDYINLSEIVRYSNFETFEKKFTTNLNLKKMIFFFLEEKALGSQAKFIKKLKIG